MKGFVKIACLIICIGFIPSTAFSQQDSILSLHLKGDTCYNSRHYDKAALLYERASTFSKDRNQQSFSLFYAASAWALAGKDTNALNDLQRSASLGWADMDKIRKDSVFVSLYRNKGWNAIITEVQTNAAQKQDSYFWGVYFGIMLILLLYNLFLYFSVRDLSYLYFSVFMFLAIQYEMFYIPQFGAFLLHSLPWYKYLSHTFMPSGVLLCVMEAFFLLFVQDFLNLKKEFPILSRIVKGIIWFYVLNGVNYWFGILKFLAQPLSTVPLLLATLLVFVISIMSMAKGFKPARFFVLANTSVTIGFTIQILRILRVFHSDIRVYIFTPDQIGFIAFLCLLSFALGNKINTLKAEIIVAQEKALEVLEEKVQERTTEIVKQKEIIEEKNNEVLSSISYAKRLQDAILPPLATIKKHLPESFVMYKPKDIVAGDFYWMYKAPLHLPEGETKNSSGIPPSECKLEAVFIAACDCTGHGVPGAMVSVVCSNALNRAVKEFKITEPGKILDKVRELVIETFEKSENEVKDGMDVSLASLTPSEGGMKLCWAGAYNSLWYIQDGAFKELAPDKQPIGVHDKQTPFNTHTLELRKGDCLYLFTDGYADQFGGPKGKKFKYKQLEEKLLSLANMGMDKQKEMLEETIGNWMGKLEQVDDILIIGIRV